MGCGSNFGSTSVKANKPKNEQDFHKAKRLKCQCSGSSQIPIQDDLSDNHQFLSLYSIAWNNSKTELTIYNTKSKIKEVKILDIPIILDIYTSITQLPNGELFCYGNINSGIALVIYRNYKIRMLPSGYNCYWAPVLYFDNNIYCFGGYKGCEQKISRKFDFIKNRWISLASLPKADSSCHSVIFNGNILVSGFLSKYLRCYSIEIDSFSAIPYEFTMKKVRLIINVGGLYLIEGAYNGLIYESDDEYDWRPISKSGKLIEAIKPIAYIIKEKFIFLIDAIIMSLI